jgi:hypothetical protein
MLDSTINLTRAGLGLIIGREVAPEEWMLLSALPDSSSWGGEAGTEHIENWDGGHSLYHIQTITYTDLKAYMAASKKYLSKELWERLVTIQENDFVAYGCDKPRHAWVYRSIVKCLDGFEVPCRTP